MQRARDAHVPPADVDTSRGDVPAQYIGLRRKSGVVVRGLHFEFQRDADGDGVIEVQRTLHIGARRA